MIVERIFSLIMVVNHFKNISPGREVFDGPNGLYSGHVQLLLELAVGKLAIAHFSL